MIGEYEEGVEIGGGEIFGKRGKRGA